MNNKCTKFRPYKAKPLGIWKIFDNRTDNHTDIKVPLYNKLWFHEAKNFSHGLFSADTKFLLYKWSSNYVPLNFYVKISFSNNGLWTGRPSPNKPRQGGSSSRRHVDSTGGSGSSCVSKAADAHPSASSSHAHHHRKYSGDCRYLSSSSYRASADRKSPPGHHHERRRESAERSGSSYVSRRGVQLSQTVTKSPERRTITVIPSPAQSVQVEEPAVEVAGPASVMGPSEVVDGPAVDGPASDSPAGDDPASDSPANDGPAFDGSAGDGSARHDDPARQQSAMDGSALQFDDPADLDGPAHHQTVVLDGAAAHGTPAGNTPSGWQDTSIVTGVSSPLFPSMQHLSTRLHWLVLCPCGLCCSDRWTRVWWFLMPRPARLHSQLFLFPEMTHYPGGQTHRLGLQKDDPGCWSDGSGLPWEESGDWTTWHSRLGQVLPLQGLHQWSHLPEMLLQWIVLRLWIPRTRSRRDPFPMRKMKTVTTRGSQQRSISCSDKLLRLQRDHSMSTPPRHAGRQGCRYWIWATLRLPIGYRGWISLHSKTRWLLLSVSLKG